MQLLGKLILNEQLAREAAKFDEFLEVGVTCSDFASKTTMKIRLWSLLSF